MWPSSPIGTDRRLRRSSKSKEDYPKNINDDSGDDVYIVEDDDEELSEQITNVSITNKEEEVEETIASPHYNSTPNSATKEEMLRNDLEDFETLIPYKYDPILDRWVPQSEVIVFSI